MNQIWRAFGLQPQSLSPALGTHEHASGGGGYQAWLTGAFPPPRPIRRQIHLKSPMIRCSTTGRLGGKRSVVALSLISSEKRPKVERKGYGVKRPVVAPARSRIPARLGRARPKQVR